MIPRTVMFQIESNMSLKPVTLITGPRQCGKTTICLELGRRHGLSYVTLADRTERSLARTDPEMFLSVHPAPLIVDEVQYAPMLFEAIEEAIDRRKRETGSNDGMFVLTGSQAYNVMEGVSQSMAGRVTIIEMSPLSLSEIIGRDEPPFSVDFEKNIRRAMDSPMSPMDVYQTIVRGGYPELYEKPATKTAQFYSDYVESYMERDMSEVLNVKDKDTFHRFLGNMASLTGQEIVYEHIASDMGIDIKTVKSWISVMVSGGIVRMLHPYVPRSNTKSLTRRPKLYFRDTGLACYLARVFDPETLRAGYLNGPMVETFIVNEIMKTYDNNCEETGLYYYRDSAMHEVDLVMIRDGRMTLIECKAGATYGTSSIKSFAWLGKSDFALGPSCIICLTERAYPITKDVYALPVTSI